MKYPKLFLFLTCSVVLLSCEKPYEEGGNFSLRNKMNRLTGNWKLVQMEGIERLNPEIDQFMSLTDESIGNDFIAHFENFQDDFYSVSSELKDHKLFNCSGRWDLGGEYEWNSCASSELLLKNQGLFLVLEPGGDTTGVLDIWKIKKLKHDELIIECLECDFDYYSVGRTLSFEKIENY
ncbi:MAG: hypothetical protein MK078_00505 [Crocinitomicaceae bacterium]|nr:hypothetical protein [Crocinitomicaceae bacterium]